MANLGVAPLDPTTPVGQLRHSVGDRLYQETPTAGIGDYDYFSDADLVVHLLSAGGSITRATGLTIKQLALNAAVVGASVKTNDLGVDNSKRGSTLLEIAQSWIDDANAEDAAGDRDSFVVIPFRGLAGAPGPVRPPELASPRFAPDPQNPGYLLV